MRKIHFFVYPIWAKNDLKNIVKQVVITQNNALQGLKWPPSNNVIFGVCRPPKSPPEPPQNPPMVQGGQNWPKCICSSPLLIINDKKMTFGGKNILTYFFTRSAPSVEVRQIYAFHNIKKELYQLHTRKLVEMCIELSFYVLTAGFSCLSGHNATTSPKDLRKISTWLKLSFSSGDLVVFG